jgi:hypothetical protein
MRFVLSLLGLLLCAGANAQIPFGDGFETPTVRVGFETAVATWGPTMSEAQIQATGAARVTFGSRTIYVGTHQVSAISQNPIVASFTNGIADWIVNDYEVGTPDGRAVGVMWDGAYLLYVAMTVDGGGSGIEAHTTNGWQTAYGAGGGPRVTVLLRLNANSGRPMAGTFSIARLANGNTNALIPTNLDFVNSRVVMFADSAFSPLDVNRALMTQTGSGSSPHRYRVVFDANLQTAVSAEAIGWNGVTQFSPLP